MAEFVPPYIPIFQVHTYTEASHDEILSLIKKTKNVLYPTTTQLLPDKLKPLVQRPASLAHSAVLEEIWYKSCQNPVRSYYANLLQENSPGFECNSLAGQ